MNENQKGLAGNDVPLLSSEQKDIKVFLVIAVCLALGAGGFAAWMLFGRPSQPAATLPDAATLADFTLVERSGRPVTRAELDGKFLVVNFIHTSCSITCFQVNQRMAQIQERLAGRDDVRLVSISVDPRTDTPPVLSRFANQFRADAARWLFLTGEQDAVDALLDKTFVARPPGAPRSALLAATDRIVLVDPSGRVRERFNGVKSSAPDAVVEALDRLRTAAQM